MTHPPPFWLGPLLREYEVKNVICSVKNFWWLENILICFIDSLLLKSWFGVAYTVMCYTLVQCILYGQWSIDLKQKLNVERFCHMLVSVRIQGLAWFCNAVFFFRSTVSGAMPFKKCCEALPSLPNTITRICAREKQTVIKQQSNNFCTNIVFVRYSILLHTYALSSAGLFKRTILWTRTVTVLEVCIAGELCEQSSHSG